MNIIWYCPPFVHFYLCKGDAKHFWMWPEWPWQKVRCLPRIFQENGYDLKILTEEAGQISHSDNRFVLSRNPLSLATLVSPTMNNARMLRKCPSMGVDWHVFCRLLDWEFYSVLLRWQVAKPRERQSALMFIESSMPSDKMLCSKVSHVDGCDSKWAADLSKETKELVYKAGRWIPMKESIWSPDRSFSRSITVILLCFANASATVTSVRTFVWPECRRCALRSSLNGMTKRGCTSRRRQSESDHAMFGRLARSSRRLTHLIGILTLASLNVDIWCRTASRSPLHTLGSLLRRKKRYGINSLDSARMMDQLQLGILSPLDLWLDHTICWILWMAVVRRSLRTLSTCGSTWSRPDVTAPTKPSVALIFDETAVWRMAREYKKYIYMYKINVINEYISIYVYTYYIGKHGVIWVCGYSSWYCNWVCKILDHGWLSHLRKIDSLVAGNLKSDPSDGFVFRRFRLPPVFSQVRSSASSVAGRVLAGAMKLVRSLGGEEAEYSRVRQSLMSVICSLRSLFDTWNILKHLGHCLMNLFDSHPDQSIVVTRCATVT